MGRGSALRAIPPLFQHTKNLLRVGALKQKPVWFDAMVASPPLRLIQDPLPRKPRKLVFLEDGLMKDYLRMNKAAKDDVLDLHAQSISLPAAVFVKRWAKLMKTGVSKPEAYEKVKAEGVGKEIWSARPAIYFRTPTNVFSWISSILGA